jgi:hypothetical protein
MIQGMLAIPDDQVAKSTDKHDLLSKLWVHEAMRVFSDRLINKEDHDLFINKCLSQAKFKGNPNDLIFCNFVDPSS